MFLPFSADRICCSCDRCALGTWFIGGKMTYWLERLDNLAVSQSSCFLRVTWQLRTERMLQLVYNEYLLLDVLDDLALADRCKQESIRSANLPTGRSVVQTSRLPVSRLRQAGSIPALVLYSSGMAVRHRKGATAERYILRPSLLDSLTFRSSHVLSVL
ncbi:hypothetical protein T265_10703 [Opisthorchis viverrini]|uniref:Uncharacterized protein n=1 Tax=Opisthorchis viverrini TaxID=6198 RepID=A0A074Z1H6_OPIVI|nr:hypothetical protein T265_10703 [Opisthorchis viverrini]KER20828.1 hypothetical protein T265_10703 [Opisthorchis viverrini]